MTLPNGPARPGDGGGHRLWTRRPDAALRCGQRGADVRTVPVRPRTLCEPGDSGGTRRSALTWTDAPSSTVHRPYHHSFVDPHDTTVESEPRVKFRCERDVLVEALGSAGRAAAGRGSSLPVLSGVRVELSGDRLRLTGSDLELTIAVEVEVAGSEDGITVLPGRLASDIVRSLPGGSVEIEVDAEQARIAAGRSEFSLRVLPAEEFPRLPEPAGEPVTLGGRGALGRRSPRWCRPRPATTPARSSPACCSPPRTAGCASSPPTRTASPCATSRARRCWPRASTCSSRPGPSRSWPASSAAAATR